MFTFRCGSTSKGFRHKQRELPSNDVADHGANKTALQSMCCTDSEAAKGALFSKKVTLQTGKLGVFCRHITFWRICFPTIVPA